MSTPVLHLLAGPNGAGKSTFVDLVLAPMTHLEVVNADEIAKERWPGDEMAHAHEASALAAARRDELMAARTSFVSETVFSHESKVDLVARATSVGYYVHLHVVMLPVETTIRRVAHRVGRGGHDVPEEKVRERFERLWELVATAIDVVAVATVYDNSVAARPFREVARFERGIAIGEPAWPVWTPAALRHST